jgi:hypothetical protein
MLGMRAVTDFMLGGNGKIVRAEKKTGGKKRAGK